MICIIHIGEHKTMTSWFQSNPGSINNIFTVLKIKADMK